MAFRISAGVSADYAEKISQGEKSRADKKVKKNTGKKRRVKLVHFKTEDRKILACNLILLHLIKTSCYSTLLNLFFPNYFNYKNELSLAMCPYDYFLILDCFMGTKRATPAIAAGQYPCLSPGVCQSLTAASSTITLECLVFFQLLTMLPIAGAWKLTRKGKSSDRDK